MALRGASGTHFWPLKWPTVPPTRFWSLRGPFWHRFWLQKCICFKLFVGSPGGCFCNGFCFNFCDALPLKFLLFARWPQKGHIASDPQEPMVFKVFSMFATPPDAHHGRQERPKNNHKSTEKQTHENKNKCSTTYVSRPRSRGLKKPPKMTSRSPPGRGGEAQNDPKRRQDRPRRPPEAHFWR